MARKNRATLRNYFSAGSLPTEDHFGDLIDSTLNMVDEGYRKSPENGVEITALGSANALASFYTQRDPNNAQWSIAFGSDTTQGQGKRLVFGAQSVERAGPCVLSLDPLGRVGVRNDSPQHALDVNGVVRSAGRIGGYVRAASTGTAGSDDAAVDKLSVPADGKPHDITGWLRGCQAFEVMAGVGDQQGQGRYALLHAIALNTFNPKPGWLDIFRRKRRISTSVAYFGSRCDRLELRWEGSSGKDAEYRLMLKTRCPYSTGVRIQFHITQLWFDPDMKGSKA